MPVDPPVIVHRSMLDDGCWVNGPALTSALSPGRGGSGRRRKAAREWGHTPPRQQVRYQKFNVPCSMFDVERWTLDELIRPNPDPLPRERGKRRRRKATRECGHTPARQQVRYQKFNVACSMFDVERWMLDELIHPHPVPLPREREKRAAPEGGQGVGTHSSAATSAVSKVQCSMFNVRC